MDLNTEKLHAGNIFILNMMGYDGGWRYTVLVEI